MNTVALRHAFSEAWSISRSGPGRTTLAVGLITLSLYIPGLLLLLCRNLAGLATGSGQPPVAVATLAPDADVRTTAEAVSRTPGVAQVRIVRSEAARNRFERTFPDLAAALREMPEVRFPTTLEVSAAKSSDKPAVSRIVRAVSAVAGVEQVEEEGDFEARFRDFVALTRRAAFVLGGILAAAAMLSIASAVRLAMDQHREEIQIMRLMGATESAIRAPFWLQGALEGTTGGMAALIGLAATFEGFALSLKSAPHPLLSIFWVKFFPPSAWILFPAAGIAAGFLGAVLSVGRHPHEEGA